MKVTKIIGINKLKKKFAEAAEYKGHHFEKALLVAGMAIMGESIKHAPIDTGALRGSHRTSSEGSGYKTVVTVYCQTAYAIFVHENLEAYHKPGTWAKFLTRAVKSKKPEVMRLIREVMRD